MSFYNVENFEIMGDILEDVKEWNDFIEDMKSNPWSNLDRPPFDE